MNLDWMSKLLHQSLDEAKLLYTRLNIVFKIVPDSKHQSEDDLIDQ